MGLLSKTRAKSTFLCLSSERKKKRGFQARKVPTKHVRLRQLGLHVGAAYFPAAASDDGRS